MLLARPLHYSIIQLHGNELPFWAVFYHYDGKPCGGELERNNWSAANRACFRPSCHWLSTNHFFWLSDSVSGRVRLPLFNLQAFCLNYFSSNIAYLCTCLFLRDYWWEHTENETQTEEEKFIIVNYIDDHGYPLLIYKRQWSFCFAESSTLA